MFRNPKDKVFGNPHMIMDAIFMKWMAVAQTARSVTELIFLAALLILFASEEALAAMRRNSVLCLDEADESWENDFA